jgi:RNA polymerase sigma factor (sigma-70 family)
MVKVDDKALVALLHEGFNEGFDSLYWKYHQLIYINVFKFVRNKEESQDILQDVFATLWESRKSIRQEQSVSGWLFVISFNKSVNHIKKKNRHSAAADKVLSFYPPYDEDPDDTRDEHYQILHAAISGLSPQKQKVFTLCKLEGKSYEEAARQLNISRHTVKEYLSLGMFAVRDAFRNIQDRPVSFLTN